MHSLMLALLSYLPNILALPPPAEHANHPIKPLTTNTTMLIGPSPASNRAWPPPPYLEQISDEPLYLNFTHYWDRDFPSVDGNLFMYAHPLPTELRTPCSSNL